MSAKLTNELRALTVVFFSALYCSAGLPTQDARVRDEIPNFAPANETPVELPPFVVSALRIDRNPWRYANIDGFEILSRASDAQTLWWVNSLRRGIILENQVLPKEWLPDPLVPNTVIIDDADLTTVPTSQVRSQSIAMHPLGDSVSWGKLSQKADGWTDRFLAKDEDTYAICVNTFNVDITKAACTTSLRRIFQSTPLLPRWLIEGLLGKTFGVFREGFIPFVDIYSDDLIRSAKGPGTLWESREKTQQLLELIKKKKSVKLKMLSLSKLFAEASPLDENVASWESEAALFVRWGLMGPGRADPKMSRAFMQLVQLGRNKPITESVFIECFGFGFSTMEEKLASYLKTVIGQPTSVELNISSHFEEFEMTDASADQIGRILGDWSRMQASALKNKEPKMSAEFLHAAGQALERAYRHDNGLPSLDMVRRNQSAKRLQNANKNGATESESLAVSSAKILDPKLLSVYGLYEHDIGNDDEAAELLAAATKIGVIRPMAYITLAEIRYKQAMAKPSGTRGQLSAQQARSIIEPLNSSLCDSHSSESYRIAVETWENCAVRPSDGEIEKIADGAKLYPRYTSLAYHSALLCIKNGYKNRAEELVEIGLYTTDEKSRRLFEKLYGQTKALSDSAR